VFEYACRADTFALPANPVRGVEKRRENYTKPPDTFTAEQILSLARAAREGRHVNGGRRWASAERDFDQERANVHDAAIYTVAGFTRVRQGELRALRWKHVRFADRTIVVVAGISAVEESGTKSGKWRAVPLTREAFVVLDELSRREWFIGPEDCVCQGDAAMREQGRPTRVDRSSAKCFVNCCLASWTWGPPPPRGCWGSSASVHLTTRPPHMT
jgi:integrase